jgi:uncharacterized membrane protein
MNATSAKKTPRRWVRALIWVSFGLNVLVLSAVGGAAMRFWGNDGPRLMGHSMGNSIVRSLPRDVRQEVLQEARRNGRSLREISSDRALQLVALLRQPNFDAQEVARTMAAQSQKKAEFEERLRKTVVRHLSGLDFASRAAYADRLEQALMHRGPDGKKR